MSLYSRERRKRIRDFKRIFSKRSIGVEGWELFQIHEYSADVSESVGVDFWGYSGEDVALITLVNDGQYLREVKTGPRQPLRLFVGMKFEAIDNEKIERLSQLLNDKNAPKRKRK